MSKDLTELQFNQATIRRNQLSDVPKSFLEILMFMDYRIRKQLKSFTILSLCGGNRQNFIVDQNYQRAFNSLTLSEKISEYSGLISIAHTVKEDLKSQKEASPELPQLILSLILIKKKSKVTQNVRISDFKVFTEDKSNVNLDLRNYLMRKSKKKDKNWYVLEAINNTDPETLRFAFIDRIQEDKNLPTIRKRLYWANYLYLHKLMSQVSKKKNFMNSHNNSSTFKLKLTKEKQQAQQKNNSKDISREFLDLKEREQIISLANQSRCNKSICEDLVKNVEEQDLMEELSRVNEDENEKMLLRLSSTKKEETGTVQYRKNIFRILLPHYPLEHIPSLLHFGSVYLSNIAQLFVYHHTKSPNIFKLKLDLPLSAELACKAIYNVHLYKYWNPEVKQGQIKMNISSENSCILYQEHNAYNQWYRCRDFLTLAHLFKLEDSFYIAQKSIQHTYFAPFSTITRGSFEYLVWKIEPVKEEKCSITAQLKIEYQGMLNKSHQKQMTIKYLKGFEYLEAYFMKVENIGKLTSQMSTDWEISENKFTPQSQIKKIHKHQSFKTVDFEDDGSEISIDQDEVFYSIENLSDEEEEGLNLQEKREEDETSEHEVDVNELKNINTVKSELSRVIAPYEDGPTNIADSFSVYQKQKIEYDEEGLIILPAAYIKKKFPVSPIQSEIVKTEFINNNIILKDHWQLKSSGGLKLINQKKIDAQNNVFSFIMKTMRKNLFSGKGMLNISLPVQIFNCDSNIQRLCSSMSLAPHFLEKATTQTNSIERFKYAFCFGFSNSIIYFDVEKPFNPILGQTYQGYIRGCPVYGQQTSHHPPISSIYFVGRGYKVHASLEAKVYIHLNSGQGVNEGFYHIDFEDGTTLLYQGAGGELSGLSVGDRGYNFKGRAYILDKSNGLYGEMRFQESGGFFSKKKLEYADQVQGQIVRVKDDFFTRFLSSDKRSPPSDKQIVQKVCQISGRWPFSIDFDGKTYYDILNDIPDILVDEIYPLNSNSLYRQDLQYRTMNDLVRSQIEKQRLEVKQRGDRKLRQKFTGTKH